MNQADDKNIDAANDNVESGRRRKDDQVPGTVPTHVLVPAADAVVPGDFYSPVGF